MKQPADRPRQPFIDRDGTPRVRSVMSRSGPVDYRTGQAIIDIRLVEAASDGQIRGVDGVLAAIADVTGLKLEAPEIDRKQADRSGFIRVTFGKQATVIDVIRTVEKRFGPRSILPNSVLTIGSFTADPMRFASGVGADPMRFASAYGADPMRFANSSTARPAAQPVPPTAMSTPVVGPGKATVAILDTGMTPVGPTLASDVDFVGIGSPVRDRPDENGDDYLDIAAGHTTFIRTIIQRASPAAEVMVEGVIHNDGDGDEADIANALHRVFDAVADKTTLLVNLSFSGYYADDVEPPMIGFWIRELVAAGAVVVAAAGNNGACRKKFPAAMAEVIAVGALGPCGPASFSNHGSWVEASAPGEDLISGFFANFDGAYEPIIPGLVPDIDDFSGWAMWSGTSFSTPTIVGALAELIERHACTAREAVGMLLRRPGLYRMPDYGVIVNRVF